MIHFYKFRVRKFENRIVNSSIHYPAFNTVKLQCQPLYPYNYVSSRETVCIILMMVNSITRQGREPKTYSMRLTPFTSHTDTVWRACSL